MKLRLIRHATLQLEYAGQRWLVDPMFSPPGQFSSLTIGVSAGRNPRVPLPCQVEELLHCDVIAITHTHFDHFDRFASEQLSKTIPVICQLSDSDKIRLAGFENLLPIDNVITWQGVEVTRIEGEHGQGVLGRLMGASSGYILRAAGEPTVYIAGDTIGCPAVYEALQRFEPTVVIVNTGAAQFNLGQPIVMTAEDVIGVSRRLPQAQIVAVHMEAINHCRLTRQQLAQACNWAGVAQAVSIPQDGEWAIQ
jgi:L-ascorbate metabolism protein UlaG (beta-lactamase superfamily)